MIVYSQKIFRFITDIKNAIRAILASEVGLKVARERFYDTNESASYPINVVVYNNRALLGYFDSEFYELGFHESLMHTSKEQLHDIIRHEIAHYITFIEYGGWVQPHGHQFRAFCDRMGWGESVYRASVCLEGESTAIEESPVLRKVQKLMALSKSGNSHEAEAAMIKSQELLLKHNIETTYFDADEDTEKIVLKRILKEGQKSAKMSAIATILGTFFVSVVFNSSKEAVYLEILGSPVNVEIAEYVANFLQEEFEKLWLVAKNAAFLKGKTAKNSFFLGIARGYCNKVEALKKTYQQQEVNAVMVIEKQLETAKSLVYKRLSKTSSSRSYCKESSLLGERMGRALSINPALNKSFSPSRLLTG